MKPLFPVLWEPGPGEAGFDSPDGMTDVATNDRPLDMFGLPS